jgi:hypothetical protein
MNLLEFYKNKQIEIPSDFDEIFYQNNYSDLSGYWYPWAKDNGFSEKQRLFHHYYLYGKKEGRHKNQQQKYAYKIKTPNISKIIPRVSLKHFTNNLECIVLLVTDNEIQNGQYIELVNRLISNTTKEEIQKIHFKIIVNNIGCCVEIKALKTLFSNVEIIDLNLNAEEDLYLKDNTRKLEKIPKYGRKSGPNIMFYRAIGICKNYNTTLFLETDCFFRKKWLQNLKDFVNHSNGFWISGAIYDGFVPTKAESEISTHINGGVGLYATGNEIFQLFIDKSELFLIENIKNGSVELAYDISIKMYIDNIVNTNIANNEDILVAKFINRQYLPNKIIGNFSTIKDTSITLEQIQDMYNYYIIHKK